jgi:hypothetical protein
MTAAAQVPNDTPVETILGLEVHPDAALLPLMEGEAFDELVESVRRSGLKQKIATIDGQILDGRNRGRALEQLGREAGPHLEEVDLNGMSPAEYVMAANLHRRHLTATQRRELAADLAERFKAEQAAKPKAAKIDATQKAADATGLSRRTVARAEARRAGKPHPATVPTARKRGVQTADRKAAAATESQANPRVHTRKLKGSSVRDGAANGKTIVNQLTGLQRWLTDPRTTMTKAEHAKAVELAEDISATLDGWQV